MKENKTTIIERVRKLLALATSSNEHEAALAAAHAQRLLAEHNLGMTDIEFQQEAARANKVEATAAKTLPKWIWKLLGGVKQAFDCDCVHYSGGRIVFIGVGADAQVAAYTFAYLDKTIRRLCRDFMKNHPLRHRLSNRNIVLIRQSYYLGASTTVYQMLLRQKVETPVTTGALVPIKDALIKKVIDEMGDIKLRKARKSYVDPLAYEQGQRDGRNVAIHHGVEHNGSAAQAAIGI